MTKQTQDNSNDQWSACPTGEIQQMVQRKRSRSMAKKLTRATSATAIVAVLAIGVVVGGRHWLKGQTDAPVPGTMNRVIAAITCNDVVGFLPAYVNDTLHRDEPQVYEAVFAHLQHCPMCDAKKKELQNSQSVIEAETQGMVRFDENASAMIVQQMR
jgi:hypothetical protein